MKSFKKNLLLGIIIIAASISGFLIREREMQSYVVETITDADDIYSTRSPSVDIEDAPEEADGKININTASVSQLQRLDGIGPEKAKRIIRYREQYGRFEVIEDIMKVEGIGRKTFEKFKDNIIIE